MDRTGRLGAQIRLLFHGGLRPSEMLGQPLRAVEIGADGRVRLKIIQRADRHSGKIGRLKSKASRRIVTLG